MKRLILGLLVILLLIPSVAYGSLDDKLTNHWANNQIDRSFMAYYFPYLAKDGYERFDTKGEILEQEFHLSLASLFKDYNYDISGLGLTRSLSREEMVNMLGKQLIEIGLTNEENTEIPFKDINTMTAESIELLRLLYKEGIIKGDSNTEFIPERNLSQVEAIIILQRTREVLERMNSITFNTLGIVQTYNSQEEIIVTTNDNKVLVTVTKQFPTPGYSMSIDKILKEKNGYKIFFNITPPKADAILPQVITYKTVTIEIDKNSLGDPPYNFILEGYNKISTSRSF